MPDRHPPPRPLHRSTSTRFAEELTGYARGRGRWAQDFFAAVPARGRRPAGRRADCGGCSPGDAVRGVENPVAVPGRLAPLGAVERPAPGRLRGRRRPSWPSGRTSPTLKQAQERALQAERLAAIGQMVAGLAHESGNALAAQPGLPGDARPGGAGPARGAGPDRPHPEGPGPPPAPLRGRPQLRRPAPAGARAVRPGRRSGGRRGRTWRSAARAARPRLREESAGVDLRCAVDPFRLEQVFRNILENALAACRDPVEVDGPLRRRPSSTAGRPCASRSATTARASTPEQRRRIFEPFYTTKTQGHRPGHGDCQADRRGPRRPDRRRRRRARGPRSSSPCREETP